ncbi:MAG: hypothetical protein U0610_06570 [bacterium]
MIRPNTFIVPMTAAFLTIFASLGRAETRVLDPGPGTDYLSVWCGGQTVNEIATGFDAAANAVTLVKVATTCHGSGRGSPNQYYLACWSVTFADDGIIESKQWLATNHWAQGQPSIPCPVGADPSAVYTATDGAGNFPETLSTGQPSSTEYRALLETSCASIAYGGAATGVIGAPGETACYSFRGTAGDAVKIDTVATSGSLVLAETVFGPDGSARCASDSGVLGCTLEASGRHVIVVGDHDGTGTGGFDVALDCVSPACSPFDYALANSGTITATAGTSGSNTITATLSSGLTESVSFTISGLPEGATATFDALSCEPDCTSQLTVTTTTSTEAGTYPITVSAAPLGHATVFNLTVVAPAGCGAVPGGEAPPVALPALVAGIAWAASRLRRASRAAVR